MVLTGSLTVQPAEHHLRSHTKRGRGTLLILRMRKLRHREVKVNAVSAHNL